MRLTVLNVSYPLAAVSEDTAGGAEQILGSIDEALVSRGHCSIVLAPEGSDCAGKLVTSEISAGVFDQPAQHEIRKRYRDTLARVLDENPVDIVHMHGIDFLDYLPEPGVPVVVTLHLPPSWYPPDAFRITRPGTYLICVSESQRSVCPSGSRIEAVIENGVPVEKFVPGRRKNNYVAALGRICPEKGFHLAMDAASRVGVPLYLAGNVYDYPTHREYFEEHIRARLQKGHRFLGPVGGSDKNRLLAEARCVLIPSLAPETSSLVAMEAMACGTPVIAFPAGALPEIVTDGTTGFLVNSVEEMADAIVRADTIDSARCRREAEQRFSSRRMCEEYLDLYKHVANACGKTSTCEVRV